MKILTLILIWGVVFGVTLLTRATPANFLLCFILFMAAWILSRMIFPARK